MLKLCKKVTKKLYMFNLVNDMNDVCGQVISHTYAVVYNIKVNKTSCII